MHTHFKRSYSTVAAVDDLAVSSGFLAGGLVFCAIYMAVCVSDLLGGVQANDAAQGFVRASPVTLVATMPASRPSAPKVAADGLAVACANAVRGAARHRPKI
ncbi:MAG: hypothetical protein ACRETW_05905 [Stenotrophobium sp.]